MSVDVTDAPVLQRRISWMHDGTRLFLDTLATVSDTDLTAPSLLPHWSRAHVVSHLARNADALCNLLAWARTGVETPMYPSRQARAADIEAGVGRTPAEIRADVDRAAQRLATAVADLPDVAWSKEIRTASGRAVGGSEVPWMRVREVWVHAVDLDAGVDFTAVPPDVAKALLDDALSSLREHADAPALTIHCTELDAAWPLGDGTAGDVAGTYPALLSWALGRRSTEVTNWPDLPAWL